jgi:hypothetical protein
MATSRGGGNSASLVFANIPDINVMAVTALFR